MNLVELKTFKEITDYSNAISKFKYKCKCGHKVVIPAFVDKNVCGWCGKYVFKDKKSEFKFRMEENLRNAKRSSSTI